MDGAVRAVALVQSPVRRRDNSVCLLFGDVADYETQCRFSYRCFSGHSLSTNCHAPLSRLRGFLEAGVGDFGACAFGLSSGASSMWSIRFGLTRKSWVTR